MSLDLGRRDQARDRLSPGGGWVFSPRGERDFKRLDRTREALPGLRGGVRTPWNHRPMAKDRRRRRFVARDVQIVTERTSAHPVEYAVVLLVLRDGRWQTVRTFDNAHDPTEHHEHRYVGDEKQPPAVTHGPVNEAMHAAEVKLLGAWSDIVHEWEHM